MRVELSTERGSAPLYVQLASALQDVITLQHLRPGDVLPSETVLAAENQLSRATVIKAYDTLIERGLVTRRQGKGTFVNAHPMERRLPDLTGFSEHVHGLGLAPGSRLLSFDQIAAGSPDRPSSPFPSEQALVAIERLRTVGGTPVGLHRTLIPADVAERSGLDERSVARDGFSLYATLRAAGVHLASGEEALSAINANDDDAELLGVEAGIALIEIVRDSYDSDGRLIEVVRARYLGSQYRYHIEFAPRLQEDPLNKRTAALLAPAVASILLLTACAGSSGSGSGGSTAAKKAPVALIVSQGGLGDKSYNDFGYSGFTKALKQDGLTGKPVESADPVGQAKTMLTSAGRAGYGAVIDLEYTHSTTLPAVAKAYPKADWALINATAPGKNVASVLFQEQEGSYLAGALAAMQTQNTADPKVNKQNVIGVIGGAQSAGIDKFIVGYIQGAKAVDPSIKVLASYSNDFANPSLGAQLAKSMYGQGADVVYGVAGGTGLGIIKEAKAENHYAIGVDADQDAVAPGFVLTTMLKRTDVAVETLVKDYSAGTWPGGKTINLGLAQNGVGISDLKYTKSAIGTDAIAKIDTMRKSIVSGRTKVWNVVTQGYPTWYKK